MSSLHVVGLEYNNVYRARKSPLIFGAKTDREMREWMMAIKLLAEKLNDDRNTTTPVTAPAGGLLARAGCVATRRMSQQSQQHLLQVSRRDDITRRSSPQLQIAASSGSSAGQIHIDVRGMTLHQ